MSKVHTPLTSDFIVSKGSATPVSLTSPAATIVQSPANNSTETAKKASEAAHDPLVPHNFRVKKSFKRAFDQAAFDEEMTAVKFLHHLFALYQKRQGAGRTKEFAASESGTASP